MSEHDGKPSRIAIQLGKSHKSELPTIKNRARPAHGKRHRAHALHEESESEDNGDNEQSYGQHEAITSYDLHGGIVPGEGLQGAGNDSRKAEGAKDGRDGAQFDRDGDAVQRKERSPGSHPNGDVADSLELKDRPIKWGLTINMRKGDAKGREARGSGSRTDRLPSREASEKEEDGSKSIDDEALDALMGTNAPKRRRADSDAADREPRPEDYRAVPIDDFGATLLRNFGWDGKMRGKVKEVTRHANLTGLGAKDAKGAEDLGAWNQKLAKDSRPVRLDDYQREERKKRQRIDDRYADSYKRERERERERERGRGRDR